MSPRPWTWTTALLLSLALGMTAWADDDDDDDDHEHGEHESREHRRSSSSDRLPGVAPVDDPLTAAECGSCHLAYPAGLLPARSWVTLMGGLQDHFGDDASLSQQDTQAITAWLVAHAADTRPDHDLARRVARSVPADQVPLRILDVPWLRHEHDEIPASVWRDNPEVGSLSNCASCHPGAAEGRLDEHGVRIPGVGRWDD